MAFRKLAPHVLEKEWGATTTGPWLENTEGRKIGEIWFADRSVMPVLVKFLFTSDRLSVQVHPDDTYAQAHGEERGKTEMWPILQANPGSTVAIGLSEKASGEQREKRRTRAEWGHKGPGPCLMAPSNSKEPGK